MAAGGVIPVATLLFRFAASTQNLTANVASAKSAMRSLVGSVATAKAALFVGLTAVGIAAAVAFRKSLTTFAAVDAGLREISTLLPITAEGIRVIANELGRISARTGEAPEILTEAFYQSVSAGFTDIAESLYLTETAAFAATAGLTDTATAMDAITTVLRAYGKDAAEAKEVSDILFTTVKDGKVRFADLASNIGTVAKTAALSGVSLNEVAAAVASVTAQTGQVEESFTAINRLLVAFSKNTDNAAKFAREMNIEFDVTRVRQEGLLPLLEEVNEKFGDNTKALAKLAPQYRAFRGLAILASDEGLEQFKTTLDNTNESLGATYQAFLKVQGSLENQKKILAQQVNKLWLRLGKVILPEVVQLFEHINTLLESDTERRIRFLREIGEEEAALALIREQVIDDYAQSIEKLDDTNRKNVEAMREALIELSFDEGVSIIGSTLLPDKVERDTLSEIAGLRQNIAKLRRDDLTQQEKLNVAAALQATAQEQLATANEKYHADLLEIAALAQRYTDQIEAQIYLEEERQRLLAGGELAAGDGDDPPADPPEPPDLNAFKDAAELIDQIARDATTLSFFDLGPFDELPELVGEWKDRFDDVLDQMDALIEAEEELAEQGDARSVRAGIYVEQLKAAKQALLDQREALKDSLEFVALFGEEVADLFGQISDEDRTRFAAYLRIIEKQLNEVRDAQAEVEATDDGTKEREEALKKLDEKQQKILITYRKVVVALKAMGLSSKQLADGLEIVGVAMDEAGIDTGKGKKKKTLAEQFAEAGKTIEDSARAVITLADAFDVLDDSTRKVLNGILEMGGAIRSFATGNYLTGGLQAFSGFASIFRGLTDSEPDPAEVARLEELTRQMQNNSDSLRRLTEKIDDLAQFVGEVPGGIVAGFADAVQPLLDAYAERYQALIDKYAIPGSDPLTIDPSRAQEFIDEGRALRQSTIEEAVAALEELGITVSDIEDVADAGEFEVSNLVKIMQDLPYSTQEAVNAMGELEDIMEALAKIRFDALFEGFQGLERQIDLEEQLSDNIDPAKRLERLIGLFDEMSELPDEFQQRLDAVDFGNLDLENLNDLESLLNDLFLAVLNDPTLLGALGEFNPEAWIEALTSLTDVVDELQATAEEEAEDGPDSTSFQVFRGITEVTGNRIAGIMTTDAYWNRITALNTGEIAAALGGEPVQVEGGGRLQPNDQMEEMIRILTTIAINSNQLRHIAMFAREIAIRLSEMSNSDVDRINRTAIVRAIQNQQLESRIDYDATPLVEAIETLDLAVDLRPLADSVKGLRIEPQPITDIQSLVDAIEGLDIRPETIADIRPLVEAISEIEIRPQEVDSDSLVRALERVEVNPQPITDIQPLIDAIRGLTIEPSILNDPRALVNAIEALTLEPQIITDVQPLVDAVSGVEVSAEIETEVAPLVHAIRNLTIEPQPITEFDDLIEALSGVTIRPETIANIQPLVEAMRGVEINTELVTDVRPLVDAVLGLEIENEVSVDVVPLVEAIQNLTLQPRFLVDTQPFADALSRLQSDIRTALDVQRIVTAIEQIRIDPSQVIDITPLAEAIEAFEIDPTNVFNPDAIIQAIEDIEIQTYSEIDTRALVDAIEAIQVEDTSEVDLSPLTEAVEAIDISVNPVLDAEPVVIALREFAQRLAEIVNTDEVVRQISELELVHTTQFDTRALVNAIAEAVENKPPVLDSEPLVGAIEGLHIEPRYVVDAAPIVDAIKRVNITPESLLDAESIVRAIHALEIEPRLVVDTAPFVEAMRGVQVDPRFTIDVAPITETVRDLLGRLRIAADPRHVVGAIEDLEIRPSYETDITPVVDAIEALTIQAPTIDLTPLSEALLGVSETLRAVADPSALIDAVRGLEVKLEASIDTEPMAAAIEVLGAGLPDPTPLIDAVRSLEVRPAIILDAEPIVEAIRSIVTEPEWVIPISSFIDELRAGVIAQPLQPPAEQMLEAFLAAAQYAQPTIGTLNIGIDVEYRGEDEEAARDFGSTVGTSVMEEIDRQMADRYVQQTRTTGSPTKRTA